MPSEPTQGNSTGERPARVTIREVAELAGVSIATVSRVLNGRADVSDETRQVVRQVARDRGYGPRRPQPATTRGTGLIGVTMPFTHTSYFAAILSGAAEALYERDMRAVLCPTRHEHEREVSLLDRLMHGETDGAVLMQPEESNDELRLLTGNGFSFVVVDPLYDLDEGIPVVSAAHASGAIQATRHLLEQGHRRIGVITGPPSGIASRSRLQGYHAALAGAGLMPDPALEVCARDFVVPDGVVGANHLLALPEPPTAIFAFSDSLAIGTFQAARARGLRLPADLSVVGFDDTRDASIVLPALTTVRQPLAELGRMAVTLLVQLLGRQSFEPLQVELATKLVIRESTAPLRH